jgi:hypothetical protein
MTCKCGGNCLCVTKKKPTITVEDGRIIKKIDLGPVPTNTQQPQQEEAKTDTRQFLTE